MLSTYVAVKDTLQHLPDRLHRDERGQDALRIPARHRRRHGCRRWRRGLGIHHHGKPRHRRGNHDYDGNQQAVPALLSFPLIGQPAGDGKATSRLAWPT